MTGPMKYKSEYFIIYLFLNMETDASHIEAGKGKHELCFGTQISANVVTVKG